MANETYSLMGLKNGTTEIGGLTSKQITHAIDDVVSGAGGSVYPTHAGILANAPGVSFSSLHIAELLALVGITGHAPSAAEFAFQQNTLFGTRAAAYVKGTPYKTLWVPRRLSAAHNQAATIEYYVYCFGDASNKPLQFGTASATYSQVVSELFTLGPQSINSTDFEAQSLDIDFGIEVETGGNSGISYPIWGYVKRVQPTITIRTLNLGKLTALVPSGAPGVTLTSWIGFLRKVDEGGAARVADATTEHVQIELTEGVAYFTQAGGGHGDTQGVDITIKPTHDGTNAILQIDTTAAIA